MTKIGKYLVSSSLILIAALMSARAKANDLDVNSAVDAVTVYPDGASVTRIITLDLPSGDNTLVARDFPISLDPSSLRVEGEAGAQLTIGTIDTRAPRAVPPANLSEIDKRIEALQDQRDDLQGMIAAAEERRKFARRFAETVPAGLGEKGEARPLAEWRGAFAAVGDEIATADAAIRDAQRKQRDIDRQIAKLQSDRAAKPPNKLEVRIELAAAEATKATLRVTYAVGNARWTPLYDARLDSGTKDRKPTLELVRRAEITQSTGEDWSNVTLDVSTVRVARGGNAPDINSLIVRYLEPRYSVTDVLPNDDRRLRGGVGQVQASHPASQPAEAEGANWPKIRAEEQQAATEVGTFQVAFKIAGRVSVGASTGARSLRISTLTIRPDLLVRSAPSVDPTAFLEASFQQNEDDAPLLPGVVSIYRDGIFVGRGRLAEAGKDETVRLGFGADDKVRIERSVVRRREGSAGVIVATKTDERAFKTSVRNNHDFPIKVAIEDQLPVSENSEIAVEMLPSTTAPTTTDLRDRRGVLEWAFEAKPGELRTIAFAWRVRWPRSKEVVMTPSG